MKKLDVICQILLILGGLNWGIWSIFEVNVIDYVVGKLWLDRVIYFLIGVSAVFAMFHCKCICKICKK